MSWLEANAVTLQGDGLGLDHEQDSSNHVGCLRPFRSLMALLSGEDVHSAGARTVYGAPGGVRPPKRALIASRSTSMLVMFII